MTDDDATWREKLEGAQKDANDEGPVIAYAPNEAAFDVKFDDGYGGSNGPHVLAWTASRVYFPVTYDGQEWIDSAPRNPVDHGQQHVGGE